jgi:SAM-dependent methyltransferase
MSLVDVAASMREAWNARARRDPFRYVETAHWDGDVEAFFALGEDRCALLVDPVLGSRGIDPSTKVALDLGCGVGRISRALARRFATAIGVDVSDEMIERAVALHPREAYPNLRFAASDGLALPLEDASVDFAFSYEVVQHMPTHDVILRNLREIRRVLRPGGIALVHVHTAPTRRVVLRTRLVRLLPAAVVRFVKTRVLGHDPLTCDESFRGAPPLDPAELGRFFADAGLAVDDVRHDPTHAPGARALVVARPDR